MRLKPSKATVLVFLLLTGATSLTHAQTTTTAPVKPAQIDKAGLLLLVRSTLHALDLANKSGNYTILREIGSPAFAASNDAARLSQIFKNLRELNLDLSGVLVYEPELTLMPQIDKNGYMKFGGFFPSPISQIKFEMIFAPIDGKWKIFGLMADVVRSGPAPSAAPPPPNRVQQDSKSNAPVNAK